MKKFGTQWYWVNNYTNSRGRIWLGWHHHDNSIQLINTTKYLIHFFVQAKKGNFTTYLIVVYGLHIVENRRPMWSFLENLANSMTESWCVIGDFNEVLCAGDRINGNSIIVGETKDFEHLLDFTDLIELKSSGS